MKNYYNKGLYEVWLVLHSFSEILYSELSDSCLVPEPSFFSQLEDLGADQLSNVR